MFYEPAKNDHGLPYAPFKSCVVPRPIGWISTLDLDGRVNLAPFSQFNMLGYDPPYVMFSADTPAPHDGHPIKDSVRNAQATREFVFNMATYDLRDAMNRTALIEDPEVDEMAAAGLTPAPSRLVKPPRVAESPVHFECRFWQTLVLPGRTWETTPHVVIGTVVGIHIKDEFLTEDGRVDVLKIRPLARLGYLDYTTVDSRFELSVDDADDTEAFIRGMAGDPER